MPPARKITAEYRQASGITVTNDCEKSESLESRRSHEKHCNNSTKFQCNLVYMH